MGQFKQGEPKISNHGSQTPDFECKFSNCLARRWYGVFGGATWGRPSVLHPDWQNSLVLVRFDRDRRDCRESGGGLSLPERFLYWNFFMGAFWWTRLQEFSQVRGYMRGRVTWSHLRCEEMSPSRSLDELVKDDTLGIKGRFFSEKDSKSYISLLKPVIWDL